MSSGPTSGRTSVRRAPSPIASLNRTAPGSEYGGHHLLDPPHREIGDGTLRETEQVADRGDDDVPDRGLRDHLLQRDGEVLEDHDRLGAGIPELVLELARRVERVDVHDDAARAQCAGERDRVLRDVRHHERNARTRRHATSLQPGTKGGRLAVDLCKADTLVHERIGVARRVARESILDQVHERTVLRDVDVGRNTGRVMLEPESVHRFPLRAQRGRTGIGTLQMSM